MLKKFRSDVRDISDNEIKSIQDKDILSKEHDHINKILLEKEKLANHLVIVLMTGIVISAWNLFNYFKDNKNIESFLERLTPTLDFGLNIAFIAALIFVIFVILELSNRTWIINRKQLILNQQDKLNKKNKKYITKRTDCELSPKNP